MGVHVWDVKNPSKHIGFVPALDGAYIRAMKLLPHSHQVVVGGETKDIVVLDLEVGVVATLATTAQALFAMALSKAAQPTLFACLNNGVVETWDLRANERTAMYSGHGDGVSCIDVSPDGNKIITGSLDKTVKVWDIRTQAELANFNFPSQVFSLAVCPQTSWLATGEQSGKVSALNLMSLEVKEGGEENAHSSSVLSLRYTHNGQVLISTGQDAQIKGYSAPCSARVLFNKRQDNSILCSSISANDQFIVTGNGNHRAVVYALTSQQQ